MGLLRDNRRGWTSGQRGFTLVEILITLVILVIGIYGMLRVFPPGFSAIEVGEQRTIAAQLAEAELARWKLHPEALPDAVVATDYDGALIQGTIAGNADSFRSLLVFGEMAAVMPGTTNYRMLTLPLGNVGIQNLDFYARSLIYNPLDLTPSQFDGAQAGMLEGQPRRPTTSHPTWQPNSLHLPRTVLGERLDIRRLGRTVQGIPFYLLSHAPLDVLKLQGTDNPATPTDERSRLYVLVYDAQPWSYLPLSAELLERQFTVDRSTGVMSFGPTATPPAEARVFKVDYTDPTSLRRVIGFSVTAGAGGVQGAPALPRGVDPATVQVHEQLQQVNDPALLQIVDSSARRNIYYVEPESTISGRIMFPLVLQVDPRPTDIALVKVDYRVYDWSIVSFDIEVPTDGAVRLPIGPLKGPSFTNAPRQPRPQEVARGVKTYHNWDGSVIQKSSLDPTTWAYVVAIDRQSGDILTDHEGVEWPPNPYDRRSRFLVDYITGVITFNFNPRDPRIYGYNANVDTADRSGRTYRIYCRGASDWAVQLMVTPRVYGLSSTLYPGGMPIGEQGAGSVLLTYSWPYGLDTNKDPRQVYFPLSESGQAVAIDYYYRNPDTGEFVLVEGEVHTIGKPNVTDLGQWVCPLSEPLRHTPNEWGPWAVRGIGVRARAVWVSPGRTSTIQDLVYALSQPTPTRAVPSVRETWRQQVVDTYLTGAPI
ncbi:MAG: prepilin-type N-terminal cleavage/methylation domain-containing protein [Armatimonadota bacterium]